MSWAARLRSLLSSRLTLDAGLRAGVSIFVGFVVIALTNAVAIAVAVPWPRGGLALRAAHHAFDFVQTVGLGVGLGAIVGLGAGLARRLWVGLVIYAGCAMVAMYAILGQDLTRQAYVFFDGRFERPLLVTYVVLCGLAAPVAHLLGAFFSRFRWLRVLPLAATLSGIVVNHAVLRDDYPGVHGAIAWIAATLVGATLGPAFYPRLWEQATPRRRAAVVVVASALAGAAVFIAPSNRVRLELFREPGATGAWLLAQTVWSLPEAPADVAPPSSPWLADRAGLPPVPPSNPPIFVGAPVVVFITIDAVRADVIDAAANERVFPTIAQLKRTGAYFTNATSPGSQTSVSLTTVFSGRYFSQLFWALHGRAGSRFTYAAADPSPRFPELLTARGVRTASVCSLNFLAGEYGVIRGFAEQEMVAYGRFHAEAKPVADQLIEKLRRVREGEPAFFYAHLTEPHAPYDRGAKQGSDKERYISEIGVADAELARVARVLSQRMPDRGVLIVSSDHGEAFGEHGTWNHTKTLYEELLRVPLLIRGPGIRPRKIDQRVGLVDVGPTILDMFGVETPAGFMGQSLVPLLRGAQVQLDRPILAEGRLRRALYAGRLKVIEDVRRKVVEAYDLEADPLEMNNLFPERRAEIAPVLAELHAFMNAHAARAPGYSVPYKP